MNAAALQTLLPLLILIGGATVLLLAGAWGLGYRRALLTGATVALLAALVAGAVPPQLSEVGGMLSAGPYSRACTILFGLLAALTLLLSVRYGTERRFAGGEYAALVLFAAAGMALLAGATSLVGLFLGLESLTLALYILIAFHKASAEGAEAGLKYLVLGATATGILAFGMALVYVGCGSLHFSEALAGIAGNAALPGIARLGWGLLLAALAFKLSLVPFHLWTPDVYQGAPAPVTALLATGSKSAVVAVLVVLAAGLPDGWGTLAPLLLGLTLLTLFAAPLAALAQQNAKRMLAYSSMVHMGFILLALVVGGSGGRQAAFFYLFAYSAATVGAFGVLADLAPAHSEVQDYSTLRGAGYRRPWASALLTVCLLSLAGIPATAGFIAKFGVLLATVRAGAVWLALAAVAAALVSAYYYLRLIVVLYMTGSSDAPLADGDPCAHAALSVCCVAILLLGLYPGPLFSLIAAVLP